MIPWEDYQEPGIPDLLIQYRAVQEFPVAMEPCPEEEKILVGIRSLFKDRNPEYWKQRTALETAFEERKKAEALRVAPTTAPSERWDGKGPCPVCKREPMDQSTLEAVERGKAWLKEHGDG